jgi:hypothetical protein
MGWFETIAFQEAVSRGNVDDMIRAVHDGANVNHYSAGLSTALHRCAENGDEGMLAALLELGADHAARTRIGAETPLHLAALHGHEEAVRMLLSHGADKDAALADGRSTPEAVAERAGHYSVVQILQDARSTPPQPYQQLARQLQRSVDSGGGGGAYTPARRPGAVSSQSPRSVVVPSSSPRTEGEVVHTRVLVSLVDPRDRRQLSIIKPVADVNLAVEPRVPLQMLCDTLSHLLRTKGVDLDEPKLLLHGKELTDRAQTVGRLEEGQRRGGGRLGHAGSSHHLTVRMLGMRKTWGQLGWGAGGVASSVSPSTHADATETLKFSFRVGAAAAAAHGINTSSAAYAAGTDGSRQPLSLAPMYAADRATPSRQQMPEQALAAIYERHCPENMDDIPWLLQRFAGRESELVQAACEKFGIAAPPATEGIPPDYGSSSSPLSSPSAAGQLGRQDGVRAQQPAAAPHAILRQRDAQVRVRQLKERITRIEQQMEALAEALVEHSGLSAEERAAMDTQLTELRAAKVVTQRHLAEAMSTVDIAAASAGDVVGGGGGSDSAEFGVGGAESDEVIVGSSQQVGTRVVGMEKIGQLLFLQSRILSEKAKVAKLEEELQKERLVSSSVVQALHRHGIAVDDKALLQQLSDSTVAQTQANERVEAEIARLRSSTETKVKLASERVAAVTWQRNTLQRKLSNEVRKRKRLEKAMAAGRIDGCAGGGDEEDWEALLHQPGTGLPGTFAGDAQYSSRYLSELVGRFQAFDTDGNGALSQAEVADLLSSVGYPVSDVMLNKITARFDAHDSGALPCSEPCDCRAVSHCVFPVVVPVTLTVVSAR